MADVSSRLGPMRRAAALPIDHRLITLNTEYLLRAGRVIAVRRRGASGWLLEHRALGMLLLGAAQEDSSVAWPREPGPGDRAYLVAPSGDALFTSTIVAVERNASRASAAPDQS